MFTADTQRDASYNGGFLSASVFSVSLWGEGLKDQKPPTRFSTNFKTQQKPLELNLTKKLECSPGVLHTTPQGIAKMVELGLTVLLTEKRDWIRGKSIGLITNHTGVDASLQSNYRLLAEAPDCQLSAIFSPEHGLWGAAQDGTPIASSTTEFAKVFSLYGSSTRPHAAQLEGIDLLVYDMQDVGARYYTYISTLLYAMEAAGACGVEFIVADRPNPIGCTAVEGQVLARGFESFVGVHALPVRYALTIGELAQLLISERRLPVSLKVAWMRGYARNKWYDETGLQWVPPSPNMPTLTTATLYPGMCLFEGTNMSEGRGTTKPFEYIGAPWCDGERWAQALNARRLPGVRFRPVVFMPAHPPSSATKHANKTCRGVAIHITDREHFRPIDTAIHMLAGILREYRTHFAFLPTHFDRLAGSDWLRNALLADRPLATIHARWEEGLQAWYESTTQYQFYEVSKD